MKPAVVPRGMFARAARPRAASGYRVPGDRPLAARRSYFALLYQLLVGRDTGPRLPTLLLAIGAGRVRELLSLPGE